MPQFDFVRQGQAQYYGNLFKSHGPSVDAVASGHEIYKALRYATVGELMPVGSQTVHDVGFGLGHFQDYLSSHEKFSDVRYSGSEVTPEFVNFCREVRDGEFFLRDLSTEVPSERYDCLVLTGTMYHRRDVSEEMFMDFAEALLRNCFDMCHRGIVFNLVSPFVDYRTGDLFYADFGRVLEVVRGMSRFFAINHATPFYEYSIGVYREGYIASKHSEAAFDKYFVERRSSTDSLFE